MNNSPDIILEDHGTICVFQPMTAKGRTWLEKNVGRDNGYQPYWPAAVCAARYAPPILQGIQASGLAVDTP